jgi:hypothetical protein
MSTDLITPFAEYLLRPKIVHSLPGRMRLYLPVLKQLKSKSAELRYIAHGAEFFIGVTSFEPNPISGNVLIRYDTGLTSEERIISSIRSLTKTAIAYRKQISTVDPAKIDLIFEKIRDYVLSADPDDLSAEKELRLPDEIWT